MGTLEIHRKKPVAVTVMRVLDEEDVADAERWMDSYDASYLVIRYPGEPVQFKVRTLEGDMAWTPGAWLIKGIHDEFYFCDDIVFRKTYDFVGPWPEGVPSGKKK